MREISPLLLACALGAGLSTACSDARHAPLAPVGGTVTYRGQPIKSGTMVFEVPGTRPANGKIVDGKIVEVTTYTPNDGVSLGKAAIAVFATRPQARRP